MKKVFLNLIICFFFTGSLFAQSFEVHVADTVKSAEPGEEIPFSGFIVNLTDSTLEIIMTRLTNEIPADWSSALCFETCAPPWIDQLVGTVRSNDSLEFGIHFITSQTPGEGQAKLDISQRKVHSVQILFKASTSGNTGIADRQVERKEYHLLRNFPNPFNSETKIRFYTPLSVKKVRLQVFALTGEKVLETTQDIHTPGLHYLTFNAKNAYGGELANGIYIYRIDYFSDKGLEKSQTSRLVFLK